MTRPCLCLRSTLAASFLALSSCSSGYTTVLSEAPPCSAECLTVAVGWQPTESVAADFPPPFCRISPVHGRILLLDESTIAAHRRECEGIGLRFQEENKWHRYDYTECSGGLQEGMIDTIILCASADL